MKTMLGCVGVALFSAAVAGCAAEMPAAKSGGNDGRSSTDSNAAPAAVDPTSNGTAPKSRESGSAVGMGHVARGGMESPVDGTPEKPRMHLREVSPYVDQDPRWHGPK